MPQRIVLLVDGLSFQLPIEVWYPGERERNQAWEELVAPLDVRCVDAYEVRKQHPHARLNGFESKPYAMQWSRFADVLYLDADNVPVRDPTFLFDTPQYGQCGAIFWPDYHRLSRDRAAWRVFGNVPYRDEPEVESGQLVIDKARCWRALTFANWCGERSAFFFQHGTFAAGGAACERYWTIRDGRLLIAGDDGRLTMDLTPTVDGGRKGRWLVPEKMAIRLEAKG